MAYAKRSDYLKSLNQMRNNYQNNGNALINREDDTTNVGNEMSSFAYMQTQPVEPVAPIENENVADGYHFGDFTRTTTNALNKGVFNFLDGVGDFVMTTTGWLGGLFAGLGTLFSGQGFEAGWNAVNDPIKEAINYDWQSQATNFADLTTNWLFNLGDENYRNGSAWQTLGSAEASKQRLDNTAQRSGLQGYSDFMSSVGEMLPSVAITVGTFGAGSALTTGQAVAVNAGISGAEALGKGYSKATKESGEATWREVLYAVTKGGISAGLSVGTSALGGLIGQSGGAISKLGDKVFGKTGSILLSKATEIGARAGIAGLETTAMNIAEPALQAIYDKGDALEKAYGSGDAWGYIAQSLKSGAQSAVISATIQGLMEGGQRIKLGKEGYEEQFMLKHELLKNPELKQAINENQKLNTERNKIHEYLAKHPDMSQEELAKYVDRLNEIEIKQKPLYEKLESKLNSFTGRRLAGMGNLIGDGKLDKGEEKYNSAYIKARSDIEGIARGVANSATSGLAKDYLLTKMSEQGYSLKDLKVFSDIASYEDYVANGGSSYFKTAEGDVSIRDITSKGIVTLDNGLKIDASSKTPIFENISTPKDLTNAISILSSNQASDPIVPKSINNVDLKTQTDLKAIEIPKEVANQVRKSKELTKAVESGALTKSNNKVFTLEAKDGNKIIVKPYKDKYLTTTVDKNGVTKSIELKKSLSGLEGRIVPKDDVNKFINTKAISKKTGDVIGITVAGELEKDGSVKYQIVTREEERDYGTEGYVYSKAPLYEEDVRKELPYSRIEKLFHPNAEAKKEIVNALYHETGREVIEAIAKFTGMSNIQVLDAIDKDAYINENKDDIIYPRYNTIKGGNFTYDSEQQERRLHALSRTERRNIRESASKKLQADFGENGSRNIEKAQSKVEYAKIIAENHLYKTTDFDNLELKGIRVIPKSLWAKGMEAPFEMAKNIGGKLYYCVRSLEDRKDLFKIHGGSGLGYAHIFISDTSNTNIIKIAYHENTHLMFQMAYLEQATGLKNYIEKLYLQGYKEINKAIQNIIDRGYELEEAYEELVCDINAGITSFKDNKINNYVKGQIAKVYKDGKGVVQRAKKMALERKVKLEVEDAGIYSKSKKSYRYKVIDTASNETIETNTRPTDRRYYDNKIKRWIDPTAGRLRSRNYRDNAQYNAVTTNNNVSTTFSSPAQAPTTPPSNVPTQASTRALGSKQPPNNNDNSPNKIISDKQRTSSSVLIEAGADVSKPTKVRLKSVKEAFETAIKEIMPKGGEFHIPQQNEISSMAELNLSRPKDRDTAISNMVKYLGRSIITFKGEGNNNLTFKLSDLMTRDLEKKARNIMEEVINGKAEPTKLAMWSKAFSLEKIKGRENVKSIKLLNRIDRKVTSALKEYVGAPDISKSELAIYTTLTKDVKAPFTNADITNLTNNIATNYTEDNIGKKLSEFGITTNKYLQELSKSLNASIVKGKALTAQQIKWANDCLTLIYNDLKQLGTSVKESNQEIARKPIIFAQSLGTNKHSSKALNIVKNIDYSTRSPANILSNLLGNDNPFTQHIVDGGKECDNNQTAILKEWNNLLTNEYTKEAGLEKVTLLEKKIEFNGRKITNDEAVSILLTVRSVGEDKAIKNGIVLLDKNGNRLPKIELTKEKLNELSSRVLTQASTYANIVAEKWLNGVTQQYMSSKMYEMSGVTIAKLEDFYYPTSRAGQKEPDYKVSNNGSVDPITWGLSYLKERTNSQLPYLIRPFTQVINTYKNRITQWGEWATWYKKLRTMENTKVFGTTFTEQMRLAVGSQVWDKVTDFIHRTALGIPFNDNITFFGRAFDKIFGNLQKVKMLDLFTQIKTLGSLATGWQFSGLKISAEGTGRYIANIAVGNKKINEIIFKYSPTLEKRRKENIAFSANIMANANRKVSRALSSPVRVLDWRIHLLGFAQCQVQAKKEGYGDYFTDSNNKYAVKLLEKYSDTTQPTTSAFNVGMYRAGANGVIIKRAFGMFASMGQNIYQGLYNVSLGWAEGVKRVNGYLKSIEHEQERIDFYTNEQKKYEEEMNKAQTDEEYIKAKEAKENADMHKKSHEDNKKDYQEAYDKEAPKYTKAKWFDKSAGYIAGLVGSGIILTLIASLKKKVYGTEEWSEWDIGELSKEAIYQSFVNWIPYISTIANSIKNDRDLTLFTLQDINDLIDASKTIVEAIQSGDGGKITGSLINALNKLSAFFGIPAESMWKLVNGIWYNADHASNIAFKSWLGMYKPSYLRTNYNEAVKAGNHDKAVSSLEVWLFNNSIPTSKDTVEEIYRLNVAGITGIAPRSIPTEYTNEKGEAVKLTDAQVNSFKKEYSKANKQIEKALSAQGYKKQTDDYKSGVLKKIYNAYYESAKARVTGVAPNSKLAQLVYYCSNDIDTAKYVLSLQQLSTITEDKKHSKKELVIKEINKMAGFNKNEKLLLAYLSGYSASNNSKPKLVNFLISLGMDREEAQTFLRIEL